MQLNCNELLIQNQRLDATIKDYAIKFAQIQQQLADLMTKDSNPKINDIETLKNSFKIFYDSNLKRYTSAKSTGMLLALENLHRFFNSL
jgi:hypothetical protein